MLANRVCQAQSSWRLAAPTDLEGHGTRGLRLMHMQQEFAVQAMRAFLKPRLHPEDGEVCVREEERNFVGQRIG